MLFLLIVISSLTSCNYINDGLVGALELDNLERVKEAVENGADVNKVSILFGPNASPLLYSMRNGQLCISEYLLSKGADPNFIDNDGISILMYTVGARKKVGMSYAAVSDDENYKTLLNDERTDINLTGKLGYTALDYACRDMGKLTTVNCLINHGAKVTTTTMQCAIEGFSKGSCEISVVKVIFDRLTQQGIPYGINPEIVAAIQGDTDKLSSFVQEGKMKETNKQQVMFLCAAFCDAETLQIFVDQNMDLEEKFYGDTLLDVACSYGKLETVKYLVNNNIKRETSVIQLETFQKETALTKAIRHNRFNVVEYLLKCGAEFQTFEGTTQENDLEIACGNGNLKLVKLIIDNEYPLTDYQLSRAMIAAAFNNRINILEYFLEDKKVNVNVEGIFNETVLGASAWKADLATIQYLLDCGADINGDKARVRSPLDSAVIFNRLDVAKYLIENGADVNVIGVYSDTGNKTTSLLVRAVQEGYLDMVKLLVENGANINYEEEWPGGNKTALDIAKKEGSKHIIKYLENAQGLRDIQKR